MSSVVPAPGPSSVYCTLFNRDEAFSELAEAELRSLSGGEIVEPGVLLSAAPVPWAQTAFGLAGGRQLAAGGTLDEVCEQLRAQGLAAPTFGFHVRRIPATLRGAQVAKRRIADAIGGDVDYANPQLQLVLVMSARGYRVLLEGDPGDGSWLAVAKKPHNLLIALPVRLARAALHLSVRPGESVFDPFCGSGTVPLVAAFGGHPASGSDISRKWVAKAKENADHFGQRVTLSACDARTTEQRADCIITNPPYGTYCHLGEGAMSAVLTNLKRLAPRLTLISTEPLADVLQAHGFEVLQIVSTERERFERFIYVTRVAHDQRSLATEPP